MIDPENPVVKLCAEGMKAEGEGRPEDAAMLFMKAWELRTGDLDACIAAHYVARHQPSPDLTLLWNQRALDHANAIGDERIAGFYPSLYLNMGNALERSGNTEEAKQYFALASESAATLPDDRYGRIVRDGIARGEKRNDDTP